MIEIRMHQKKWRLEIRNEEFEFETKEEMNNVLQSLLAYKDKYGQIR